jgi:hypothetical protein
VSDDFTNGEAARHGGGGGREHFERYNRFIDLGWFAVLGHNQAALWLTYNRYADKAGVAYPKGSTLAKLLGHKNTNHIGRLRRELAALGLLEVLLEGGGSGHRCHVRVNIPPAPPTDANQSGSGSDSEECDHSGIGSENTPDLGVNAEDANTPDLGGKHSGFGRQTLRIRETLYKDEQPIEQPIEQPTPPTDVGGASVELPDGSQPTEPPQGGKRPASPKREDATSQKRDIAEELYQAYPRKVGKAAAKRAIDRTLKTLRARAAAPPEGGSWGDWLLSIVNAYAEARRAVTSRDPEAIRYTPHPAKWFNAGRYDDDPRESERERASNRSTNNGYQRRTADQRGEFHEDLPHGVRDLSADPG